MRNQRVEYENSVGLLSGSLAEDMYNFYGFPTRKMSYFLSAYHDLLQGNLEAIIRELYDMEARRFLVAGLPPSGCLPVEMTLRSIISRNHMLHRTSLNEQNMDSQDYNTMLQALTSMLQATFSGSKVTYTDIYSALMDMIMNPSRYGFEKTREGCCGTDSIEMAFLCNVFAPTCANPSNFLFWDAAHPTQTTYSNLAKIFEHTVLPGLVD